MGPVIADTTLRDMLVDFNVFDEFFREYVRYQSDAGKLIARFAPIRLADAHALWKKDIDRLAAHSLPAGSTPDHFKTVAHLAYWLRRCSPIVEFSNIQHFKNTAIQDDRQIQAACDLLYDYCNEYLAFDIGVQFCRYYEQQAAIRAGARNLPKFDLDHDFIETTCCFLKEKNVSPHALFLIYKALFYRRF